jgi:mannitol-1-phosphate/altronate dehydrogenase
MPKRHLLAILLVLAAVVSACGGSDEAQTCDDIGDQTIAQMQSLIDSVDDEFGEMTLDEFLTTDGQPSNLDELAAISEEIERRSDELACSGEEVAARVIAQLSELTAETEIGRVFLDLLVSGGV